MYISKASIRNVRAIRTLDWELEAGSEPGWHVFIGDNGSGKSTVLKAIALALIGPTEAVALTGENWANWPRYGSEEASVRLDMRLDSSKAHPGLFAPETHFSLGVCVKRGENGGPLAFGQAKELTMAERARLFSASIGPYRRFSGGNERSGNRRAANNHLSLFDEGYDMSQSLVWLKKLHVLQLEEDPQGAILDPILAFINQGQFLPNRMRFDAITSQEIYFIDGNNQTIPLSHLSDGYRSILCVIFEIIRLMLTGTIFKVGEVFNENDGAEVTLPGIVLIDEIDAHLHPSWQAKIGFWLTKCFPNIQFLVSTHSPLVCQATEHGTIWAMPNPNDDGETLQVFGESLQRLRYGNVLDAYSTGLFGHVALSDLSQSKHEELALLNQKARHQGLSDAEATRQKDLRSLLVRERKGKE